MVKKIEEKGGKSRQVKLDKFSKFIDKLLKKTLEEITAELNLSDEREPLIIPALVLYKMMAQNVNPKVPRDTVSHHHRTSHLSQRNS